MATLAARACRSGDDAEDVAAAAPEKAGAGADEEEEGDENMAVAEEDEGDEGVEEGAEEQDSISRGRGTSVNIPT